MPGIAGYQFVSPHTVKVKKQTHSKLYSLQGRDMIVAPSWNTEAGKTANSCCNGILCITRGTETKNNLKDGLRQGTDILKKGTWFTITSQKESKEMILATGIFKVRLECSWNK
jgi:hypothetical protein